VPPRHDQLVDRTLSRLLMRHELESLLEKRAKAEPHLRDEQLWNCGKLASGPRVDVEPLGVDPARTTSGFAGLERLPLIGGEDQFANRHARCRESPARLEPHAAESRETRRIRLD